MPNELTNKLDQAFMMTGDPFTFTPAELMDSDGFRIASQIWADKEGIAIESVHRIFHNGIELGYNYARLINPEELST